MSAAAYALVFTGAAWWWGRSTSYRGGNPTTTITAHPNSIDFADGKVVVIEIYGWMVQRWRIDPTAHVTAAPRLFDLEVLTDRAPRAPQGTPRAELGPRGKGAGSPVPPLQQTAQQMVQTQLGSAYATQTAPTPPPGPSVSVGPDGNIAAWVYGRELFVSALDSSDAPFVAPLQKNGCVPELGDGALALACRDGSVEIREVRGRVRGEIQRETPWALLRDRGNILALSGSDLFEIRKAGDPYTRVNLDVAKSIHAIARSDSGIAIASGDGKVLLGPEDGPRVELTAPGVADAVAFFDTDSVLVGGSFRGVSLLRPRKTAEVFDPEIVGVRALAVRDGRVVYGFNNSVRIAPVVSTRSFTWLGETLLGAALLFVIGGVGLVFWPAEVRRAADLGVAEITDPRFELPLPDPPDGLIQACLAGDCVLYAGAGLSAQAGYPTWQPFVEDLLKWSREDRDPPIDAGFAESLQAALRGGQVDPVADSLVSAIGRDQVMKRLTETFGGERRIPETHRALKRIPLCAALTTNFDTLFERTYPEAADRVFTPRDADRLIELLGRRTFFISKLYGSLSAPETVLFGPADYTDTVARNLTFSRFMEGLFVSRTLFFVGAGLAGIETYLSGLTFRGQMTRPHYALVAVTDAGWRAKGDLLRRRYGIEVVAYTAGRGFDEVPRFLEQVAQRTSAVSIESSAAPGVSRGARSQGVRKLHLTNIGPFPDLSLDLQSDWNVILGDNGVGKSSILKAIAACFCGKDGEVYAARLVRSGETSGTIVLETARETYRMDIKMKDNGLAEVSMLPTRPLEVEGMLALGFPALRAVSWSRPPGATAEGRQQPVVEDLLPIVKGDPDPRLDRLKQWIVNLDSRINYEKTHDGDKRYERLLQRFFDIVDRVTPGMSIRFGRVNQSTREVTVITDDGQVPIELISQGSVSLMGWIGVLLQRLYEVYPDDGDPTQRYALVLIDEIDAHMHPEWQQSIVDDMTGIFPNVQFMATTHSPLVVGGMKGRQVVRFVRDAQGHTSRMDVTDDMLVGRADQILTGRPFGMKTTLDQQTQGAMEEYKTLLGKASRTPVEEQRFQDLHRDLKFRIPNAEETAPARRAFALVEAVINDQIGGSVPEARQPLLDKARALLDEVSAPSNTRAL